MIHYASRHDHFTLCRVENTSDVQVTIHRRRVSCGACAYRLNHPRSHRDVIAEHVRKCGNAFEVVS